jgi:hypothetical protein
MMVMEAMSEEVVAPAVAERCAQALDRPHAEIHLRSNFFAICSPSNFFSIYRTTRQENGRILPILPSNL